ncbi:hypothetical protein STPYR_12496 [uncultured Stenotrophomonas sp.]|uniref:Uncharacterized protein n=1 Tax=uncultured Stenotrophomonas sp. TaxID=165438 RepID=A0A1Y5Q5L8_9GAMM|nr:hypothetical protein STPYR_12496 [uncultured Stenotrophomonas sp.]
MWRMALDGRRIGGLRATAEQDADASHVKPGRVRDRKHSLSLCNATGTVGAWMLCCSPGSSSPS